jgi:hypothetical protein
MSPLHLSLTLVHCSYYDLVLRVLAVMKSGCRMINVFLLCTEMLFTALHHGDSLAAVWRLRFASDSALFPASLS